MNALFPFFWTLGWAFLTQVLLFQHGQFWGGYGLLAVHLYGLLKMPVGWPPTTYLVVTAVTGACMDLVCLTGGDAPGGIRDVGHGIPFAHRCVRVA